MNARGLVDSYMEENGHLRAENKKLREALKDAQAFADTMRGWSRARRVVRLIHVALGCKEKDCAVCTLDNWGVDSFEPHDAELAMWRRSHKALRRKLRDALAEEARLRNYGGPEGAID